LGDFWENLNEAILFRWPYFANFPQFRENVFSSIHWGSLQAECYLKFWSSTMWVYFYLLFTYPGMNNMLLGYVFWRNLNLIPSQKKNSIKYSLFFEIVNKSWNFLFLVKISALINRSTFILSFSFYCWTTIFPKRKD
jgi:hypothetical protein